MWIFITALIVVAIATILYFVLSGNSKMDFTDKYVLITGGSSGIGECMAYLYSNLGAKLILASNVPTDVTFLLPLVG